MLEKTHGYFFEHVIIIVLLLLLTFLGSLFAQGQSSVTQEGRFLIPIRLLKPTTQVLSAHVSEMPKK